MEQGRLFLAIALSFLVFVVWEFVFVGKQPVTPLPEPEKITESPVTDHQKNEITASAKESTDINSEIIETPGTIFNTLQINTPLYSAKISEKGAGIVSFVLQEYKESIEKDSAKKELISEINKPGTALLNFTGEGVSGISNAVFTTDFSGTTLKVKDGSQSVSFFRQSSSGLLIEKKFTFYADSYKIKLDVILKNMSSRSKQGDLIVSMTNSQPTGKRRFTFEGPFAFIDNKLKEIKIKDLDKENKFTGTIDWAGLSDQYFMTVLIPETSSDASIKVSLNQKNNLLNVQYIQKTEALQPGTQKQYDYSLFLGPKRMSVLKAAGGHLDKAINFGFFDIIAKPCLWLMDYIYEHFIPNYGIAIILLTLLFKIIFWPLGTKSYKSMAEMKKLQPLMAEIKKKYKDDKKKMNEETMGLYKTYKVNPLSGCLPMVVQIPVFFAFYRMLYGAIELRHAPFLWWVTDLSAPDRLFTFNFSVPMMTPPYGIPVLTIIMGATMFLQQKLSPPPGDPSQAKFMMMMPLIFTVIFVNFPAGLVLYWLTNNILSISQQYYITKKIT